jgi:hypothetical protein
MGEAKPLRLIAQEPEEVAALSAALQDAVGKIGDFLYEPDKARFTLALNRYRWEAGGRGKGERVRAAFQAGSVISAKAKRLKQGADDAVVSLLSIVFEAGEAPEDNPGGALIFTFAGGGELRLDVECVDLVLADISEPWRAVRRPAHPDSEITPDGKTAGRVDR